MHGRTTTIWLKPLRPSGGDDHVTKSTLQKRLKEKETKTVTKMVDN